MEREDKDSPRIYPLSNNVHAVQAKEGTTLLRKKKIVVKRYHATSEKGSF